MNVDIDSLISILPISPNINMGDTSVFKHPSSIRSAITDSSLIHESAFIGGKWVSSNKTFPVYDPATNNVIANIADLDVSSFKLAINHAEAAFKVFKKLPSMSINGQVLSGFMLKILVSF